MLWNGVAQTTTEYCKQGDLIGIKGRIETNTYENDEGQSIKKTNVIADKVTFLSSAKTIVRIPGAESIWSPGAAFLVYKLVSSSQAFKR